jgi:V/A-type H+-transporting ATPase subunit E
MEVQLQEIIGKIKKEGLESATVEADRLRQDAEKQAKEIIARAQAEAQDIITKAKVEAKKFEDSAKASVAQAGRDLTLTVKKNVESLFARLSTESVKAQYSAKTIEEGILTAIKSFSSQTGQASVQVDPAIASSLSTSLLGKLKDLAGNTITLEAGNGVKFGFKIKDGGAYYDFTAEAVAKALASYVNPTIASILNKQD